MSSYFTSSRIDTAAWPHSRLASKRIDLKSSTTKRYEARRLLHEQRTRPFSVHPERSRGVNGATVTAV